MALTISGTSNGKLGNLSLSANTGDILDSANTTFFGADEWRLTTSITGTNADITSNLERSDHSGAGYIGTGMTESSGIFTFPNTGIWVVTVKNSTLFSSVGDANAVVNLNLTTDNSSYAIVASANNGNNSTSTARQQAVGFAIIDVTDVSLVKVKFSTSSLVSSSVAVEGSTSTNFTSFKFIRLGNT